MSADSKRGGLPAYSPVPTSYPVVRSPSDVDKYKRKARVASILAVVFAASAALSGLWAAHVHYHLHKRWEGYNVSPLGTDDLSAAGQSASEPAIPTEPGAEGFRRWRGHHAVPLQNLSSMCPHSLGRIRLVSIRTADEVRHYKVAEVDAALDGSKVVLYTLRNDVITVSREGSIVLATAQGSNVAVESGHVHLRDRHHDKKAHGHARDRFHSYWRSLWSNNAHDESPQPELAQPDAAQPEVLQSEAVVPEEGRARHKGKGYQGHARGNKHRHAPHQD